MRKIYLPENSYKVYAMLLSLGKHHYTSTEIGLLMGKDKKNASSWACKQIKVLRVNHLIGLFKCFGGKMGRFYSIFVQKDIQIFQNSNLNKKIKKQILKPKNHK